jgi:hypothetical protein
MRAPYCALRVGCAAALLLCLSASADAAPAKGGKKKAPPKTSTSPISAVLREKAPQVQECVIGNALDKGAKKVDIRVKVTINKAGAVVNTEIEVTSDGGDKDKTKTCVESLVRAATWPAISTPLATAEQSWTLTAQ